MRRDVLAWIVFVGFAAAGMASAELWVPLTGVQQPAEASVKELRSGVEAAEVEIDIPGVELEVVDADGQRFTRLEIPGLGRIGEVGEPMLPVLRRFVEIPRGASVSATIDILDRQVVDLAGKGLPTLLYPVQLPRPKCDCPEARAWRFSFQPEAYTGIVAHPEVAVGKTVTMRDHNMVMLTMAPVSYDASTGILEIARRVKVTVTITGGDVAATRSAKERLSSRHFDDFLHGHAVNLNFGGKAGDWSYPDSAPIEFLIVTPPQFVGDLQPFVDWKTSCGFRVTVATTDVAGTTTTAIKSYITGLYNGPNPPVYILMIGDSPSPLPTYTDGSGGSGGMDLPFVQMNADLYPDMMIGRWPIDDATQLANMRDKTLFYEQPTAGNSAWLNRALFLAGDDYIPNGVTTHEDTIAELMEPAPNSAECELWFGDTENPTTSQLIADLNGGRGWAVYSAHCGQSGWSGDPPFSTGDPATMNNADLYSIGVGHCCQSNMWNSVGDVFGEDVVTQANKGFVTYWGGSNNTMWDEDDWLQKGFFDSMFDEDMSGNLLTLDRQWSILAACYSGLTEVTLQGGNESYYWACYNLNGDPTLDPFTRLPLAMTVGAPAAVPPVATDEFTVTVSDGARGPVPGALIGVTQGGTLLGAGFTNDTGTAVFHIDAPAAGTDLLVRVTAHNHLPTDQNVTVAAGSDGVVMLDGSLYVCNSVVAIDVFDDDLSGLGTIAVTLEAQPSGASTSVNLAEQGGGFVRYQGTATLGVDLVVAHGDTLTVTYHDADIGDGSSADKTDSAALDCAGPVITGTAVSDVFAHVATVSWTTDEGSSSVVTWDSVSPPAANTEVETALVTDHVMGLTGLQECSDYYLFVSSTDIAGNMSVDNNTGAYYSFTTPMENAPSIPSTDTPMAIPDDNPTGATSVISVPDNKDVLDVNVEVNISHTYDGDLDLFLIGPNGTQITLCSSVGGSGANFSGTVFDDEASQPIASGSPPFSGSYQPAQALSAYDGISAIGDWSLKVVDHAGSDTGTITGWTLTLTYPASACGPHCTCRAHTMVGDTCPLGGAGNQDGVWDSGEAVQFSVTLNNNGTDTLTGVSATLTPLTPGVTMIQDLATYQNIAIGSDMLSDSPHFTVQLPEALGCGDEISFQVDITTGQGSWSDTFSQIVGTPLSGNGTAFEEAFEAGIPVNFTIEDGSSDGHTWFADSGADPLGCSNTDPNPPITGTWAAVDSDCAGSGINMDESLITPPIDLTGVDTATLEFDHYLNHLGPETADVDIRSTLTGGNWVNLGTWSADTNNPDHESFDITAHAVGAADVQIRWHYYNADYEWFWYVDNVTILTTAPGGCDLNPCVDATVIFIDGFESGDVSAWSGSAGGS